MKQIGLLLILLCTCGCTTKRILEIHTEPPGAHVWVNGTHMKKRTPVEVPFVHYGYWDVRVEKAGYESVSRDVRIKAGVDGYPIVDLFVETVTPEKRFRRVIQLPKRSGPPTDADVATLLKRAQAFRAQTYEEVRESSAPERLLPGSGDILP